MILSAVFLFFFSNNINICDFFYDLYILIFLGDFVMKILFQEATNHDFFQVLYEQGAGTAPDQ